MYTIRNKENFDEKKGKKFFFFQLQFGWKDGWFCLTEFFYPGVII